MATLLTDAEAASLGPGKYRIDGVKGLYLRKSSNGAGFFYLRYSDAGRRPELTLGLYPEFSLVEARAAASEARRHLARGEPVSCLYRKQLSQRRMDQEHRTADKHLAQETMPVLREWKDLSLTVFDKNGKPDEQQVQRFALIANALLLLQADAKKLTMEMTDDGTFRMTVGDSSLFDGRIHPDDNSLQVHSKERGHHGS